MQKTLLQILIGATLLAAVYLSAQPSSVAPAALKLHDATVYEDSVESYFARWALKYGKQYASEEERLYRLMVFAQNLEEIAAHNARANGEYFLGENQFADLTNEEWRNIYLGYKRPAAERQPQAEARVAVTPNITANISWTSSGALGQVLNQGQCGSCWAFSTVENLQAVNFLNGNAFTYYSEQQLVDCSTSFGNDGCNGGLMTQAFQYVVEYGIETATQYPYTAEDGTCQYNSADADFVITGYTAIPQGGCDQLVEALATQPIAVAVDAQTWQFYRSGVFNLCGESLDHGVQLVGYFNQPGETAYWTVKNSWGSSWGEKGYIQLANGNTCGICQDASTGNLKSTWF
jgi:hypothetical protein